MRTWCAEEHETRSLCAQGSERIARTIKGFRKRMPCVTNTQKNKHPAKRKERKNTFSFALLPTMPHKALDILGYTVISPLPSSPSPSSSSSSRNPRDDPTSSQQEKENTQKITKWIASTNANLVLKLDKPCVVRIFTYETCYLITWVFNIRY